MKVVSNISAWGGFSNNLATPQDWSAYDGFSFWFKGSNTGHELQFEVKDGGVDGEHAELWESHVTDDSANWKLVRVPFSTFTLRKDYQPPGAPADKHLDLTKMWGFSMNLQTGANSFDLDDVQVYQQVQTLEDFEGTKSVADRHITQFSGGGTAPLPLAIEAQPRDGVTDNHALKADYDVPVRRLRRLHHRPHRRAGLERVRRHPLLVLRPPAQLRRARRRALRDQGRRRERRRVRAVEHDVPGRHRRLAPGDDPVLERSSIAATTSRSAASTTSSTSRRCGATR